GCRARDVHADKNKVGLPARQRPLPEQSLVTTPCTSPERAGVDPAGLQVVGVLAASVVVERSAHTQKRLGDQWLGHREVNLEANMLLVDAPVEVGTPRAAYITLPALEHAGDFCRRGIEVLPLLNGSVDRRPVRVSIFGPRYLGRIRARRVAEDVVYLLGYL